MPCRPARLLPIALVALAGCIPGNRPDPAPPPQAPLPAPGIDVSGEPAPDEGAMPAAAADDAIGAVAVPAGAPPPPFKVTAVVPNASESAAGPYKVVAGDTLRRISDKTGAASEAIARDNGLAPPFTVRIGQRLRIPAGRWHQVRAGETGIAIARAYGVEWARIVAANALEEPYILRTGQRLMLPSAREVAGMSVEARAAAFRLDIGDLISGSEPALSADAEPAKPRLRPPGAKQPRLPATTAVAAARPFDGRFDWPLEGPILTRFGPFGSGRRNEGINIGVAPDTAIRAAADGVVLYAGTDIAVYGGLILIRHSDRWTTAYGHAATLLVTRGQAVKRGQIIARAGESGNVTTPQLHFEIRQGRRPVDPVQYLPARG